MDLRGASHPLKTKRVNCPLVIIVVGRWVYQGKQCRLTFSFHVHLLVRSGLHFGNPCLVSKAALSRASSAFALRRACLFQECLAHNLSLNVKASSFVRDSFSKASLILSITKEYWLLLASIMSLGLMAGAQRLMGWQAFWGTHQNPQTHRQLLLFSFWALATCFCLFPKGSGTAFLGDPFPRQLRPLAARQPFARSL